MLAFDPIHGCSEAEDTHEGRGCFLVSRGDGPPFLEPAPHALDTIAVAVDEVRAARRSLAALGGHGGLGAYGPNVGAQAI